MCRIQFIISLLCCYLSLCLAAQDNCEQDHTLYCRGSRAVRNVLRNLNKSDKPLVIMRGMEIVPLEQHSLNESDTPPESEQTLLDSLASYLRSHELNLKLGELLADEELERNDVLGDGDKLGYVSEARKKDKGQGLLLAMALMFGKMMAVLGLGGIGALALKALGVSMMALMMAGMLGLKTAAQHGNESSHSVSYLTAEGHHHKRRRRRAAGDVTQVVTEPLSQPLAYREWIRDQL